MCLIWCPCLASVPFLQANLLIFLNVLSQNPQDSKEYIKNCIPLNIGIILVMWLFRFIGLRHILQTRGPKTRSKIEHELLKTHTITRPPPRSLPPAIPSVDSEKVDKPEATGVDSEEVHSNCSIIGLHLLGRARSRGLLERLSLWTWNKFGTTKKKERASQLAARQGWLIVSAPHLGAN